jgi:hypothetical protein
VVPCAVVSDVLGVLQELTEKTSLVALNIHDFAHVGDWSCDGFFLRMLVRDWVVVDFVAQRVVNTRRDKFDVNAHCLNKRICGWCK